MISSTAGLIVLLVLIVVAIISVSYFVQFKPNDYPIKYTNSESNKPLFRITRIKFQM